MGRRKKRRWLTDFALDVDETAWPTFSQEFLTPLRSRKLHGPYNDTFYYACAPAMSWGDTRFIFRPITGISIYVRSRMRAFGPDYNRWGATNWFGDKQLTNLRRRLLREVATNDKIASFEEFEEKFSWTETHVDDPPQMTYRLRHYWRKNWRAFMKDYSAIQLHIAECASFARRHKIGITAYGQ